MEPKILEEDRDEWIYSSMKRYSNLYMFELEFPADIFEVIDATSICLAGCQPYSKKTEILQLALPPKLFPKDIEEGLCKDRDFQIVSGGYATNPILQIKAIKSSSTQERSLVVTTQSGEDALTLYQLGNADSAVIKELCKLPLTPGSSFLGYSDLKQSPGQIDTTPSGTVFLSSSTDKVLEWELSAGGSSTVCPVPHKLAGSKTGDNKNKVTKIKASDASASIWLLGDHGVVSLHDLRSSESPMSFTSSKSRASETLEASSSEILYSFDTIGTTVGIIDSFGGYETFDIRNPSSSATRRLLPSSSSGGGGGILREKFSLQYSPNSEREPLFLVSGLDCSEVPVLRSDPDQGQGQSSIQGQTEGEGEGVGSLFVHDGHLKRVSAAVWHPSVEKLVFSASVDSMLHAWQYI